VGDEDHGQRIDKFGTKMKSEDHINFKKLTGKKKKKRLKYAQTDEAKVMTFHKGSFERNSVHVSD